MSHFSSEEDVIESRLVIGTIQDISNGVKKSLKKMTTNVVYVAVTIIWRHTTLLIGHGSHNLDF
jgi:hypothetical protein